MWASDSNDPIDRQQIQLWTGLLLAPELIGAHVGPPRTHVTGRVTDLPIRCATALFGHCGIEWDLTECTPSELSGLAEWIKLYKSSRELLHTGRVVVPDIADASAVVHGVVAADSSRALFSYAQLASSPSSIPVRLRLPGLAADRRYRVGVVLRPHGEFTTPDSFGGDWTGRALATVGLALPRLNPADALVLELRSTGG